MPLDHYVPQVHLRKFYSPALGELMYATRKSDLRSFTPNSKSVCRIEDGSTNSYLRNDRSIEEFLKTIEPKYNAALAKLIEGKIDHESIYTIAGFAAYVIGCSPTGMRIFSEPMKAAVETMAIMADEHGALPISPEALGGRSISEILQSGDIEIEVDPKYPQAIGIRNIMKNVAAFGNFKWDILFNRFDQSPFFTSDFPVAVELTDDWRVVNRILPLAPNLAVRIRPDITIDRKRADYSFANFGYLRKNVSHTELVKINRLIVRCAEDCVFYRDQSPWVQNFISKNRRYRVEQILNKLRVGDGYLQVSTTRVVPYHPSPV
jgi:Protein of unknown function (DUF4238)